MKGDLSSYSKGKLKSALRSKAQVSMEYLIIFSIAFAMTLPLLVIYARQTQNIQADVTNAQLYKVATKIADYSDQVYYLGAPSQRTLTINFPDGINSIQLSGSIIIFNVTTDELTYLVVKETSGNVSGTIKTFEGQHILTFTAQSGGVVISDK